MESLKYAWHRTVVYVMASVWLTGCVNNESSAPISSVGDNDSIGSFSTQASIQSGNITVERAPQVVQPRAATAVTAKRDQINVPHKGNINYDRVYNIIQKGSYYRTTYQVKRGDTLFYIAWITGNDYRYLAKKNNILEPFNLNVGQILQVSNGITLMSGSALPRTILASNTNKTDSGIVVAPIKNIQLTESNIDFNKNNNDSESSNKQRVNKIFPLSNGKILPSSNTITTTTSPIATSNTAIIGWRWPTNGKVINNFSCVEGGNKGVDISGFKGQPILATAGGRVVYAGNALRGYGNLIIIKHNDDYLSAYAHNDKTLVHEQQEVRAGQKIATMGSTGTTSTKLHFEIRYKGESVNPLRYLPS